MIYNGVDIYECHFFKVNNVGKLQFTKGIFTGKVSDDFKSIEKLREAFSYCFWIMHTKETPLISKYLASAFLNELTSKIVEIEKRLNKRIATMQKNLQKQTTKSEKIIGTKYGKVN